jgi:hypothetical protein
VLAFALTHELLGELTASQRPTVTLAVSALETEGAIRRLYDGSWLLTDVARRKVEAIIADSPSVKPRGESFMLRSEAQAVRAQARQTRARGPARRGPLSASRSPVAVPVSGIPERLARDRVPVLNGSDRAARRAVDAAAEAERAAGAARSRAELAAPPPHQQQPPAP